jgi:hypothetical protein
VLQLRAAVLVAAVALAGKARGEPTILTENPGNATLGVVTVDAPPSEIYRLATEYGAWPRVFSDTSDVKIVRGDRRDARVQFRSKALEHVVEIQFDNIPNQAIRFRAVAAPPGAKAGGVYQLVPIDGGRRTRVVARLVMEVSGLARVLASPDKVMAMRRAKVQHDLDDLSRHFTRGTVGA